MADQSGKEFVDSMGLNVQGTYADNKKKQSIPLVGGAYDDRLLPERSRLEFHYSNGDNAKKLIVFVPFFENPTIKETKKANYVTYNPIGRSSSLYAYTGAQSRKFSLKATYTLPHLARFEMGVGKYKRLVQADSNEAQRSLFINKISSGPDQSNEIGDAHSSQSGRYKEHYYDILTQLVDGANMDEVQNAISNAPQIGPLPGFGALGGLMGQQVSLFLADLPNNPHLQQLAEGLPQNWSEGAWENLKAIDTMLFFTNVLRTSVMNNSASPTHGPPIIRLVHGTLYQSVPCICMSYTLKWQENMGYDLETLTPRRLVLTMNLEEFRAGDFGNYAPGVPIQRDNLVGWEAVVATPGNPVPTTDPGEYWYVG